MVKELIIGIMEISMLEIGKKENALVKELLLGQVEANMLENF